MAIRSLILAAVAGVAVAPEPFSSGSIAVLRVGDEVSSYRAVLRSSYSVLA